MNGFGTGSILAWKPGHKRSRSLMKNIIPQNYSISLTNRIDQKGHKPLVIWFSGLSGSGKSTIANGVEEKLHFKGFHTYTLDGDNIRDGLNNNLGFSAEDRSENLRRVAEIAKLFYDAGIVVLAAFITPLEKDRNVIRQIIGKENLVEIFVNTSLEECESRDVKGLYKKARQGEISNFTGITAPFEPPKNPDLCLDTQSISVNEAVNRVMDLVRPMILKNE